MPQLRNDIVPQCHNVVMTPLRLHACAQKTRGRAWRISGYLGRLCQTERAHSIERSAMPIQNIAM